MLDGRYDPAFAQYFIQNGDEVTTDLPVGLVILGGFGIAALCGALAFFLLIL